METYIQQRDKMSNKKLSQIAKELPDFCKEYFIGMEQNNSPLTRLNYATDLRIFFDFLAGEILFKPKTEITLNDINQIKSKDIELYLSYLTDFEKDGKFFHNSPEGKARKLSAVRSLFKYLYNNNLISQDESSKVKTPKLHTKPIIH